MQAIERYGVVALLFLVVTVVAVLVWNDDGVLPETGRVANAAPKALPPPADAVAPRVRSSAAPSRRGPDSKALDREQLAEILAEPAPAGIVARTEAGPDPERVATAPEAESLPVQRERGARPVQRGGPTDAASSRRAYTIRGGDTLSQIAERELGSSRRWREIESLNPRLDASRLLVGTVIQLPTGDAPVAASAAPGPARTEPVPARTEPVTKRRAAGAATARVEPGDSLWRIAARTLGDGERWREIAALNPKVDPDRLFVGLELVLPGGAAAARPAPRSEPVVSSAGPAGTRGRVR